LEANSRVLPGLNTQTDARRNSYISLNGSIATQLCNLLGDTNSSTLELWLRQFPTVQATRRASFCVVISRPYEGRMAILYRSRYDATYCETAINRYYRHLPFMLDLPTQLTLPWSPMVAVCWGITDMAPKEFGGYPTRLRAPRAALSPTRFPRALSPTPRSARPASGRESKLARAAGKRHARPRLDSPARCAGTPWIDTRSPNVAPGHAPRWLSRRATAFGRARRRRGRRRPRRHTVLAIAKPDSPGTRNPQVRSVGRTCSSVNISRRKS
jgi:hypothetical protein